MQKSVIVQDHQAIERVRSGETNAFGELVRKYQDRIFNTCWRICGNLEDARDATQEAFLRAFESIGDFRAGSSFYTWLYRVAVNASLTNRRKSHVRPTVSLEIAGQAGALLRRGGSGSGEDPGGSTSDAELKGVIARGLHELDSDHRVVVVLRDIEGLNYDEISEILGVPNGTVKSRLHRGRQALSELLAPRIAASRGNR